MSQKTILRRLEIFFTDRLEPRRVPEAIVERQAAASRICKVPQLAFEVRLAAKQARKTGELVRARDRKVGYTPRLRVTFGSVFAFLDDVGEVELGAPKDLKSSGWQREREPARQVLERARAGGARRRILKRRSFNTVVDVRSREEGRGASCAPKIALRGKTHAFAAQLGVKEVDPARPVPEGERPDRTRDGNDSLAGVADGASIEIEPSERVESGGIVVQHDLDGAAGLETARRDERDSIEA
jgi:hypothetical protein